MLKEYLLKRVVGSLLLLPESMVSEVNLPTTIPPGTDFLKYILQGLFFCQFSSIYVETQIPNFYLLGGVKRKNAVVSCIMMVLVNGGSHV